MIGKLSTVEALSASLYVLGHKKEAIRILEPFTWGGTFHQLNIELLDAYARNDPIETNGLEDALSKVRMIR
jgi:ribosome biogenesis protein Tsr3